MTVSTSQEVRTRVRHYYDDMQRFYSRLWSPAGVHYGLWESGTRTHAQSIRNMDSRVGRLLALPAGSRVLDAGCGVGGTCVYLAENHDYDMTGVTLSPEQLRRSRTVVADCAASRRPRIQIADYLNTGFPDAHLDGVYGIESICRRQG